jgi:hypothetical protein
LNDPRPVLDDPLVTVIQLTALAADHAQLDPVITVTDPLLPVEGTETVVGDTEYVHCASAGRALKTDTSTNTAPSVRILIDRPF